MKTVRLICPRLGVDLRTRPTSTKGSRLETLFTFSTMQQDTVWAVYGLEITQQANLQCGDMPFHQKLHPPWFPATNVTKPFPTQIWN